MHVANVQPRGSPPPGKPLRRRDRPVSHPTQTARRGMDARQRQSSNSGDCHLVAVKRTVSRHPRPRSTPRSLTERQRYIAGQVNDRALPPSAGARWESQITGGTTLPFRLVRPGTCGTVRVEELGSTRWESPTSLGGASPSRALYGRADIRLGLNSDQGRRDGTAPRLLCALLVASPRPPLAPLTNRQPRRGWAVT